METIHARLNKELDSIKDAGLFKQERIIQSQQNAEITVNEKKVLNFSAPSRRLPIMLKSIIHSGDFIQKNGPLRIQHADH